MTGERSTVGVVIPARNAAEYIAEAIQSVLDQGDEVTRIVVVDDGSHDDTARIATEFGAKVDVVPQQPLGPAAARNRGVKSLGTDLVAFLDADDLWPPQSLRARLELMRRTNADAVFGLMEQFICDRLSDRERRRLTYDPRPQGGWLTSAMLAKRDVFARWGAFPEHRRVGDFLEWFLAARRAGMQSAMVDVVVLRRRLHTRNMTRLEPDAHVDYVRVVRAELERRRAEEAAG